MVCTRRPGALAHMDSDRTGKGHIADTTRRIGSDREGPYQVPASPESEQPGHHRITLAIDRTQHAEGALQVKLLAGPESGEAAIVKEW